MSITLVVENSQGAPSPNNYVAGANTYVTLDYVNIYFADTGDTAWTGTDEEKKAAIVKACRYINETYRLQFQGYRFNPMNQPMDWPRWGVYDEQGFPMKIVPIELQNAQCEAAKRALTQTLIPDIDIGGQPSKISAGSVSIDYQPGASPLPHFPEIDRVIGRCLRGIGFRVERA
jgi:hypothetical protein